MVLLLDKIDLENLTNFREHLLDVFLHGTGWKISDEDRTAVALACGQKGFVDAVASSSAVLLQVERSDGVHCVLTESLEDEIVSAASRKGSMPFTLTV